MMKVTSAIAPVTPKMANNMKNPSMNHYAIGAVVLAMVNISLIACGGDSGSSTKPADDGREVATVVDMGR